MDEKVADRETPDALCDLGVDLVSQRRLDEAIEQFRQANKLWEAASSPNRKLALYHWANALGSKKLYKEAAEKFNDAIAVDPDDAAPYNGLGLALAAEERFDDAIEQYRKADELWKTAGSPDRKTALRNWADALTSAKLYQQAAEKYREAVAIDPHFAEAHNGLGIALELQEEFDDAIEQYRKAAELWKTTGSPDQKFALYNSANVLRSKTKYQEAAEKYREAIVLDPEYAGAYNGLGVTLEIQEKFDDAIEQYRKADELWKTAGSPDRKTALRNWADALCSKKLYEEAAEKYREAIIVDPDYPDAYNGLGLALAAEERFDDAIEQYCKAGELWKTAGSPNRKFALHNLANALYSKEQYKDAAEKYHEVVAIDPEYADACNGLGLALTAEKRFDDAVEQYRKADELWTKAKSNDRKTALRNWADALRLRKLYQQAAEKYREAIAVDPDFADACNGLGRALAAEKRFDNAIEQYRKADELWAKAKSDDRKIALWNWGLALLEQERFDDAIAKYEEVTSVAPTDPEAFFYCGNIFTASWRYREGITRFERSTKLDPGNPFPHHNKADALFQLGRYEDGWKEWTTAREKYENKIPDELKDKEDADIALGFADMLREIFSQYAKSEEYYQRVIKYQGDNASAWTGLAILYQQWADSEHTSPDILARLTYAIRRAEALLRAQLANGGDLQTLLSLADLQIETRDWAEARETLALAASRCDGSRLKRAKVINRQGLVCHWMGEHKEAAAHFRQALATTPGDIDLRRNLGMALLRSKQFEAAQDEFARVFKVAPAHIDSLLGAAEICIELADDGDVDQYRMAERYLTLALQHGRNRETGSKRLRAAEMGNVYYLRGYARTKRYESELPGGGYSALLSALTDFRRCRKADANHPKAPGAIKKITQRLTRRANESLVDVFGPLAIFTAGAAVFLFTQLDFFFPNAKVRELSCCP
jgi:tetratricopeptide (TPR) repeat protein